MKRILCILIASCLSASVMAFNDGARSNMDKSAGTHPVINHLTTHKAWSKAKLVKCHQKGELCETNYMRR